jgi:DNA invertase Pin-like site-specific DNA recombinase|tara:strand:+ start:42 stop:665 length:624 start_codon:yes stop_codon:yes gene_type:complete
MNLLYIRTSTLQQNSIRQKTNINKDCLIIEDKCSGSIPFFERDGGKKILKLIEKNQVKEIRVHEIDRLGRNLLDILKTIQQLTDKKINLYFIKQGLKTLNEDGTENFISKMVISILGSVAEMERKMSKERQREGIAIAKANGVYKMREHHRRKETKMEFKAKHKKTIELIEKYPNLKNFELAKLGGVHFNTITKLRKVFGITKTAKI